MAKKIETTFDRWMENPEVKQSFDEGYKAFVLSELITALMERDHKTVRGLAKEIGLSKTVIQNLRSGQQKDMKLTNFLKLVEQCGYHVVLENEANRIPVTAP
jgi:DNA-binding Xre family transcriptional regulator